VQLETAIILEHRDCGAGYRLLRLAAPQIAPQVQPGQFVHLRIPRLEASVLRRPFSVYKAEGGELALLFKAVGRGTGLLAVAAAGEQVSLLGPLGHGFPLDLPTGRVPVLVAGGYGMAALYLVAKRLPITGVVFVGGRSAPDILCVEEFEKLGWKVHVATEDGSRGARGLVTSPLDAWLAEERGQRVPEFFACGPNGMLEVVGQRAMAGGWRAWLSVDRHMCCGVGACLTCVVKLKDADGAWLWARSCKEGPVFECRQIHWDRAEEKA
jgi:dihydroorotate dehydrogenase electron transfer subunit